MKTSYEDLSPSGGSSLGPSRLTFWPVEDLCMPLDDLAFRAATAFKAGLLARCPGQVEQVWVYGSRARGEGREDSDLDILVLSTEDHDAVREQASDIVGEVYRELDYPFPISAQTMPKHHFHELLRRERLFAKLVLEEGIPI